MLILEENFLMSYIIWMINAPNYESVFIFVKAVHSAL